MADLTKIESIFLAAREQPAPDRAAYLDEACRGDADLRARVEALLVAEPRLGGFLEPGELTVGFPTAASTGAPTESVGAVIGPYKLLQLLGEGGMGTVFMAEQMQPIRRRVALKIIKPGMDSRLVIARFETERQALAVMDHANIARVLDAGTTNAGRPYFVMELVEGVPISKYCDDNHLTPQERLELFVPVCQAIQHAHQKGIIHRDIKPANVLVTLHDGRPVPKVIDFGVAKATEQSPAEKALTTGFGAIVGTLEYMSPEQAEVSSAGADTRSDIYSLGVLLYELLTGSTPITRKRIREAVYAEILRLIKEEEPPRPSMRLSDSGESLASISANRHMDPVRLTRLVRGELDWIVMKALEKDRTRRYETASAFAADVQRYLNDEAVEACPPSTWYRFRKFARRKKGILVATGLVSLALVAGMVGTTGALIEARAQSHLAREEEAQAEQSAAESKAVLKFFEQRVLSAARPKGQSKGLGRDATIRAALDSAEPEIAQAFAGQPLAEASIRRVLGLTYWYTGDYAKAIVQHERALELRRAHLGGEHPDTLNTMKNLGQALQSAGRLAEALELHQETLKLHQSVHGKEHAETLWTMNRLAETLMALGRPAEALPLYEEELQIARKTLGLDHTDTLIYMDKLAGVYRHLGRMPEAVKLLEETLRLYETKLPPDHPDRLATMGNVALLYSEVGRWEQAIPLQRQTLDLKKSALGAHHPEALITQHNLGVACRDTGRTAEALPILELALLLHSDTMGANHHMTLAFAFNLAWLYRDTGRQDEALALFQDTLQRQQAVVGSDHPHSLITMNHTGTCLIGMKRYVEADALLRDCLERRMRKDASSWWVAHTKSQLGQTATALGRFPDAEPLLLEAYQVLLASKDKMAARYWPTAAEAAQGLVNLYDAWGKNEQAGEWRKRLERHRKDFGVRDQE